MNTAMRMNTKAPGWSPMKCFEVDAVIKAAAYWKLIPAYELDY